MSKFVVVPDRCSQAVINALLLMKIARESRMLVDPDVFYINNRTVIETREGAKQHHDQTEGRSDVDGDGASGRAETADGVTMEARHSVYYGNSLGGILGSVYMSLSQQVQVASLGVPGVRLISSSPSRTSHTTNAYA